MKVVVLDDYSDSFRSLGFDKRLPDHEIVVFTEAAGDEETLVERLQGAEAVVLIQQRVRLSRNIIERLPDLRLICQTGRNLYHIAMDACDERGVVISAGGGGRPGATAEFTWGLILAALREIPQQRQRLLDGKWLNAMGVGIAGKTLGVYGLGRIGVIVAKVGQAFDMDVVVWGRAQSHDRIRAAGFDVAPSREAFFEMSDVLTIHLPYNANTHGIVVREDLMRMKPEALFVNTSRADLIAPGALVEALNAGRPGGAAVDVYEKEPVLGARHPLIGKHNVLCTPHLGYAVRDSFEALFTSVVDHIDAFVKGAPINVMNHPRGKTATSP